jgi:Family of unknown function (DUF5317)
VFILYAVPLGLLLGLLLGGRTTGLAQLRFRWSWLFLAGLIVQLVLFFDPVSRRVGDLGPPIYVGSTAVVLAAVLANARIAGIPIVALGALSNFAAIVSNGGYMPADPDALASVGKTAPLVYSNSSVVAHPMLGFLTDVFVLPAWVPMANIFSIGDVLIGLGVMAVIVLAMRHVVPTQPGSEAATAFLSS